MTLSDPITSQKLFVELRPPKAYKSLEDRLLWNAFRAGDEHAYEAINGYNFTFIDCGRVAFSFSLVLAFLDFFPKVFS